MCSGIIFSNQVAITFFHLAEDLLNVPRHLEFPSDRKFAAN